MLQDFYKPHIIGVPQQRNELKQVIIVDVLGRLQLAKWRLMSDKVPVKYLTVIPELEELLKMNPGVLLVQLNTFYKMKDLIGELSKQSAGPIVFVTARKEEERNLRDAFIKGAKGVFTLPLDLPKVSSACQRELAKNSGNLRPNIKHVPVQSDRLPEDKETFPVHKGSRVMTLKKPRGLKQGNIFSAQQCIINALDLAILCLGRDGNIININRAFKNLFQLEGPCTGKSFLQLFPEGTSQIHLTINSFITNSLNKGRDAKGKQIMLPSKEGGLMPYMLNVQPLVDGYGRDLGVFLTIRPRETIGEREAVLARSEQLAVAGQLAAGAVHEIKNPLTSVRGFIQLLQQELSDNPKAEYIDIIISEIDRVNNIVNEFLKLAKPATPKRSACSLTALFEDIRIIMESEAFLKNVVIEERYSQLPPVKIDKEQIKQVLINIMQNSFDAMTEGGRMTIQAEPLELDKRIKIDFIDTGQGMSKEVLNRIFEPFFTTKDHGTGLGLSVSQQILESHGGHIEIESESGKGTTTSVYLPY